MSFARRADSESELAPPPAPPVPAVPGTPAEVVEVGAAGALEPVDALTIEVTAEAVLVVVAAGGFGAGITAIAVLTGVEGQAVSAGSLHRHDLDSPVDPGDAFAIVAHRADDPCGSSIVAIIVHRVRVMVARVDPINIVHVAIVVVVNAVGGFVVPVLVQAGLPRVPPHIGGQVLVGVVHARAQDRHDNVGAAGGDGPGGGGADLLEVPLGGESRIVGHRRAGGCLHHAPRLPEPSRAA